MVSRLAALRGIRSGRLRRLRPVLGKWLSLNEALGSEWIAEADDAPWWYNERASLSLFAGAVWKSGGWAFEEFVASKQVAPGKGMAREVPGRCDLNFAVDGHEYVAEAKQCWPNIDHPSAAEREVRASLDRALHDCRAIPDWGLPVLAIVFAVPRLLVANAQQADLCIDGYVEILKGIEDVTLAWTFPSSARALSPGGRNKHRLYPGAALIIRRAA